MKICVINLDRDQQRLHAFSVINAHIRHFFRFPAIDGRNTDRGPLRHNGIIARDLTYNAGQLGCALSHIALWRLAIAESRALTILEDDAILAPNFLAARDALIGALPADWDIALLGWNFDRSVWAEIPEGVAPSELTFDQDALRDNMATFRRTNVTPAPIRLRHAFGTVAYAVSPTGAAALLQACLPLSRRFVRFEGFGVGVPNNGIDCLMNDVYPKIRSYVCVPPIAVSENRHEQSHTHIPD